MLQDNLESKGKARPTIKPEEMLGEYQDLYNRAKKVAAYKRISLSTLGTHACKDSALFKRLLEGRELTVGKMKKVEEWLYAEEAQIPLKNQ
jgi:hypothetical protein